MSHENVLTDLETDLAHFVPWLTRSPYGPEGFQLIEAAENLGTSTEADTFRILLCNRMFYWLDEVLLPGSAKPIEDFKVLLRDLTDWLNACRLRIALTAVVHSKTEEKSKEELTKEYYGNLFKDYSEAEYCEEPYRVLKTRFDRNSIDLSQFKGKKALDAGCGGGRYTVALQRLGFSPVVGIDFSPINIETAKRNSSKFGLKNISFQQASALELPFAEESFDYVFSNGVLHHTPDIQLGVNELLRVLKPQGQGWLYLIQEPGGITWEAVDLLRLILRRVDFNQAQETLQGLGLPSSKVFYQLDHVYAPINTRSTEAEMEAYLKKAGAVHIRKLERGCDYDHAEKVFQKIPGAREKYGVGEQRYIFSKP